MAASAEEVTQLVQQLRETQQEIQAQRQQQIDANNAILQLRNELAAANEKLQKIENEKRDGEVDEKIQNSANHEAN